MAHFLADPPDDLKPFDFDDKDSGDDFDDKIGGPIDEGFIPDEDLYDAINDETFGEEMAALTADDDFADFAIRTANLALFDDEPSTSLEPPDPSQIPIPKIDRSQNLQFIDSHKTAAQKKNVIQNAPSAACQIPSSSIWATGSFNGIGSLSELYMGNQPKPESTNRSFQTHSIDFDQLPNFSSSIEPPPGLFKPQTRSPQLKATSSVGPLSAEELERKMLQEVASSQMNNQNRLVISASVNSAELEHKMLSEAMEAQKRQKLNQQEEQKKQQFETIQEMMRMINESGQKTPMSTTTMPNTAATMTPPPSIWHQQYFTSIMMMMHAAAFNGNAQAPQSMPIFSNSNGQPMPPRMWPPNIMPLPATSSMPPPPLHQFYQQWQQYLQQFATTSPERPGMPPPMMPFPPSFLPPFPPGPPPGIHPMAAIHQHQQQNHHPPTNASISTPISPPMPPPPPHLLPPITGYSAPSMPPPQIVDMVPASLHPHVEKQRRHRQTNPALPSGKTIADYAFDPYAGLMSTKEREWLIKIHIIQCLGTGDPMEDDFYYASWKQKNVLAKAPVGEGGGSQENPKYYKFEATFPATNYTAPSFMGALGKPVHSSSRIPRQIIEVANENLEEESSVSGKQTAANRQKRLRAMLMKIENGALMLIDCRDIHRKLRFFEDTCITEYIDKKEITERLERFAENLANVEASIFAVDQIPTVMLIQKGRQLVFEWLQFLGNNAETRIKILTFLGTLLNGMSKFARKIPEESFGAFICGFRSACRQILYQMDLINLLQTVNVETISIADSKLIQLTLLTILVQLVLYNVDDTLSFSIQQLFDSPIYFLLFHIPMAALKIIQPEDEELMKVDKDKWKILHQWLIGQRQKWGQIIGFGDDNLANWICLKTWRR